MPQPRKYDSCALRQAAYRRRIEEARAQQLAQKGLPSLPAISSMPGHVRWKTAMETASLLLETTAQEMQEYYDERSESWQESERGEEHRERIVSVEEVLDALRGLIL